jgi:adenylosuccinate lyase
VSATHECEHTRGHIVDSRFYGHLYATDDSRRTFCDICRYQRWLDIEAALALSQGELGMIRVEHAETIAESARVELLDQDAIRDEIRRTGHSLVGVLHAFQKACPGESGEFVHYGATTQDIQDTGQALEMRDVLDVVDAGLRDLVEILSALAREHADTIMIGRTHARAALPMTFGLKVAGWVDELVRTAERIEAMRERVVVAQLFGGVGTMAGFGDSGRELIERFASRLGIGVPAVAWHVSRDRVAEYIATLAMLAGSLARIIDEVRTLSREEFGELEEAWVPGKVGSSTMPHKRNPEACQQVVVLARLAAAQVPVGLQGLVVEHERDSRGLRLEWPVVGDVSHYTLASLAISRRVLGGLQVHEDVMEANARRAAQSLCTESLMLELGKHIGKQTAHTVVYDLTQSAISAGRPLRERLAESDVVQEHLAPEEIDAIFDIGRYVGSSAELVTDAVELAEGWLGRTRAEALA